MPVKLMNGDCLDHLKNIKDNSIDLIIIDPPYTMTKRGKSCRPNWMPNNMGDNVFNGKLPDAPTYFSESFRVLKESTHMYVFCNTLDIKNFLNIADDCGFKLHNIISMIKDTGMPNRWYLKQTEFILFFRKGKAKPINDMTSRDNIKVIMPKAKDGKLHITQKPLDLIEKLVTNSSKEGETVLDFFMGSGTTGEAALKHKRKFIGIEIDKKYFDISKARLNKK